ncbi:YceI family protein [Salinimicrobium soli]|uniref:YceI family protein n=1 Tax=Salinimicrobium soli TaxID=1254399 RepID=UPI003AAE35BE
MKTIKNFWIVLGSFLALVFFAQTSWGQTYNVNGKASKVVVEGTSNIHDWEMTANDLQGTLKVVMEDGQLVKVDQLSFTVIAESLKSGKGGMDKNAYKALNTDDHKKIEFQLQSVKNIDCTSSSSCKITATGNLTINGVKKSVDMIFDAKVSESKIDLSGNKKINMTQYKVDPPTAMFGTITTGEEVNVKFQAVYSK